MDYDAFGAGDGEDAGPKITIREVGVVKSESATSRLSCRLTAIIDN